MANWLPLACEQAHLFELAQVEFWRPLAWGKVTSDAFEYNICACHFLSLSLHLLCSYWIVSTQRKGRNWKINSPRAGSLFLARWRKKFSGLSTSEPACRQGSLQYHFCTEAPTPLYGHYITHAHNHITPAVSAMNSYFVLIITHQLA